MAKAYNQLTIECTKINFGRCSQDKMLEFTLLGYCLRRSSQVLEAHYETVLKNFDSKDQKWSMSVTDINYKALEANEFILPKVTQIFQV